MMTNPVYDENVYLRQETLKKYDQEFCQPTSDEVRALIRKLGMTGSQVAAFVGVTNSRTVRKWQEAKVSDPAGQLNRNKNDIPYAAWRLLLLRAGYVTEP
jgi:DNA-binding transcriptional regulator YiaG